MFVGGYGMMGGVGMTGMMGMMGMPAMQNMFIMMQMMQMMTGGMMQGGCGCGNPMMGMGMGMGMPMGMGMGMPMGMGMGMGNMMGMPSYMPYQNYGGGMPQMPWGSGTFPPMSQMYPPFDMSSIRGGSPFGSSLARDAAANANGPGGYCFRWVSNALERHGVNVHGASAYMAADQLAGSNRFHEVGGIRNDQLRQLPPGAVVVWDRGPGHPHGHISIALGNGHEASDRLRNQITNYGTSYRVFLPADQGRAMA